MISIGYCMIRYFRQVALSLVNKKGKNLIKIRKTFLAGFAYRFNRRYWQNQAFDRLLYACIYSDPVPYLSKVPNHRLLDYGSETLENLVLSRSV